MKKNLINQIEETFRNSKYEWMLEELVENYLEDDIIYCNKDEDIFISYDMNACFKQYAKAYQEPLDDLYNDGVFDEELQILKSEGIQDPQIWQCVKYIVEVDGNASLRLTKIKNLYILKVID